MLGMTGKNHSDKTKEVISIKSKANWGKEEYRKKRNIRKFDTQKIINDFTKEKMLLKEIAKENNCHPTTIYRLLKEEGVDTQINKRKIMSRLGSAKKGIHLSEGHKEKLSKSHKGQHSSLATEFKKGLIPWNKEKKHSKETRLKISKSNKGKKVSEEAKLKISLGHKGKKFSKNHRKNMSLARIGKKFSDEHKKNISLGNIGKYVGEKHPNWQGGISFEPYSPEFNNEFKRKIRKRDNQICMVCNLHREKLYRALDVHHINYDKLLTIEENCISLCPSYHMKTNFNRAPWIKFFQTLLSERYGYKYNMDNEIILGVNNG